MNARLRFLALGAPLAAASLVFLASCSVGPDFKRPAAPDVTGYTPEKLSPDTASADIAGGAAQHFAAGQDIPAEWWTLFHSEPLNALVKEALAANPDLQAAQAALRQSQELVYAQEGAFLPTVDAGAQVERQKFNSASVGGSTHEIYNYSTATVSVSYGLDVFGGERRQLESTQAQAQYQRFELEAAYLTLTSNVVAAAIQESSLRAQITATQDIIDGQSKQLDVLNQQFALGGVAKSAVLQQATILAQSRASLPPLQKQLAQARNRIAALAGRFPSQDTPQTFELSALQLPENLPLSLPSQLVEQRPDVRASEAQLHEASAQVGVATANMLPQFTISGDIGSAALGLGSNLFTPGSGIWSLAAGATQPIFHGGTLFHEKRAAEADYDEAAAQYRSTVIAAFQNVADALRALQADADTLNAALAASKASGDSLNLAQDQFKLGAITYPALLDSETAYQQTQIALVQAQANRFADTAALFQALGGGWWNRKDDVAADSGANKTN